MEQYQHHHLDIQCPQVVNHLALIKAKIVIFIVMRDSFWLVIENIIVISRSTIKILLKPFVPEVGCKGQFFNLVDTRAGVLSIIFSDEDVPFFMVSISPLFSAGFQKKIY